MVRADFAQDIFQDQEGQRSFFHPPKTPPTLTPACFISIRPRQAPAGFNNNHHVGQQSGAAAFSSPSSSSLLFVTLLTKILTFFLEPPQEKKNNLFFLVQAAARLGFQHVWKVVQ